MRRTDNCGPVIISDDLQGSTKLVLDEFKARGYSPRVVECARLADAELTLELSIVDGCENLTVYDGTSEAPIVINRTTRVLRRQPDPPYFAAEDDVAAAIAAFRSEQYRSAMNAIFSAKAVWMNEASRDRILDQNKVLGARIAHDSGLQAIPTVLTDSPLVWREQVRRFCRNGDVAVKAASSWAAKMHGADTTIGAYTTRLNERQALELSDSVRAAPVLLQPYIEKAFELRVTVVHRRVFVCRIDSQASEKTAIDWRHYDLQNTPHQVWGLCPDVAEATRRFMQQAGLLYAALDFIVTPAGDHLFVEANPAGQFGWIEELTGLPISSAIVDWLLRVPSRTQAKQRD